MQAQEGRAAAKPPRRAARRPLWQIIAAAAVALALLGGSFGLGWHFGVDSTRYKGGILLVNEDNPLPADYVPEALVNLYEERHSFRLARSDIYVTRETYEAMEKMFAAAEGRRRQRLHRHQRLPRLPAPEGDLRGERARLRPAARGQRTPDRPLLRRHHRDNDGFESTEQYAWLRAHAHEYGFYPALPGEQGAHHRHQLRAVALPLRRRQGGHGDP